MPTKEGEPLGKGESVGERGNWEREDRGVMEKILGQFSLARVLRGVKWDHQWSLNY